MYFDLFLPFPLPQNLDPQPKKNKKDKGKGKQVPQQDVIKEEKKDYWPSITQLEKEKCTRSMALAGHRTSFCLVIWPKLPSSSKHNELIDSRIRCCWMYSHFRTYELCPPESIRGG
jgi:hypothetical protein